MTSLPKISIIIPLYNVEEYIIECLQSVARQTYQGEIECIIVDDCGTDMSVSITEQFIADYKGSINFVIVHHAENRGLSAARNTGIECSTGNYIYFLDSDDYISDDCIEVLTEPLKDDNYDMIIGDYKTFPLNRIITIMNDETHQLEDQAQIFREYYIHRSLYVMAWNKLTKRKLFYDYDLSFLEGQLHEDDLWTYKTNACVKTIAIRHEYTYFYRLRENSIAYDRNTKISQRCWSYYQTIKYILENPLQYNLYDYNHCAIHYFNHFLEYIKDDFKTNVSRYYELRRLFKYNPLVAFFSGKCKLSDVKHQFHLIWPAFIGWQYLKLKRFKNRHHD